MATPPTLAAEYETVWNTATRPKTISVTVATNDVLVVCGATEDGGIPLSTPTGGTGMTYSLQQSVVVASYCTAYLWTAIAGSSQTYTLSVDQTGSSGWWGFNALRFSGSDGVGASNKTNVASGAPSLSLTTTADNSAVVCLNSDWSASDGTSRTWRTINSVTPTAGSGEQTYFRDAAHYAVYVGYWSDAGAAGAKTTGLSAPSGQKYAITSVEIQGTAAAAAETQAPLVVNRAAIVRAGSW